MENDLYFCLVRNKFFPSNIDQTIHQNVFQFHYLVNEYYYLVNPFTNNQTQLKTILINWSPPSPYVTLNTFKCLQDILGQQGHAGFYKTIRATRYEVSLLIFTARQSPLLNYGLFVLWSRNGMANGVIDTLFYKQICADTIANRPFIIFLPNKTISLFLGVSSQLGKDK